MIVTEVMSMKLSISIFFVTSATLTACFASIMIMAHAIYTV